jgi:hypothetical protein
VDNTIPAHDRLLLKWDINNAKERFPMIKLTITPLGSNGRELPSQSYLLSHEDIMQPFLGEALREFMLDWQAIAEKTEDLAQEHRANPDRDPDGTAALSGALETVFEVTAE